MIPSNSKRLCENCRLYFPVNHGSGLCAARSRYVYHAKAQNQCFMERKEKNPPGVGEAGICKQCLKGVK